MADKEKIKAEIERRMKCFKNERNTLIRGASDNCINLCARIAMCEELLVFIDSLQEPSVPKFKVGDKVRKKYGELVVTINSVTETAYLCEIYDDFGDYDDDYAFQISDQEKWELVGAPDELIHSEVAKTSGQEYPTKKDLEQKSAEEFCKEAERIQHNIIQYVSFTKGRVSVAKSCYTEAQSWLKSLRSRNHWKPNEEPESEDRLRKASKEYLKVLSETPYNNTPVTNAQIIVKELIGYLDNPSKYDPNHVTDISEDLLDEIQYRWEDDPHTKWPKCPYKDFKNIACHFANWQRQQMMKNVTYGEVSQCTTYPYNLKIQSIKTIDKDLKVGDKVKLIIIKEE